MRNWILKKLAQSQINDLSRKNFRSVKITEENQVLIEMIVAVAQIMNVSPEALADMIIKKERFNWYMSRMTKRQLEITKELLEQAGAVDLAQDIDGLKDKLKEVKNATKSKSKN